MLFHSVDHLPAEMPKEASHHFGDKLCQFVEAIANSNINDTMEQQQASLPPEIFNAILCMHGQLTPNYSYIMELRAINEKVKAQQTELRKKLEEEENEKSPKKRGLTRNLSLVTLSLQGHLFDTKCFNHCLDICEKNKIQFRVVGWEVGNF